MSTCARSPLLYRIGTIHAATDKTTLFKAIAGHHGIAKCVLVYIHAGLYLTIWPSPYSCRLLSILSYRVSHRTCICYMCAPRNISTIYDCTSNKTLRYRRSARRPELFDQEEPREMRSFCAKFICQTCWYEHAYNYAFRLCLS